MVKFCRECVHSLPDHSSTWSLRCHNPEVVAQNEWSLADTKNNGTEAHAERKLVWHDFPACGKSGKLFKSRLAAPTLN